MIDSQLLLAILGAVSIGFLSSLHCVGMCGGIMGALTMAIPNEQRATRAGFVLAYNIGRVATYAAIGALLGGLLAIIPSMDMALRWIAGALLIAMGLYLANWWHGLIQLERAGRYLWAYIQPLSKPLLPVDRVYKALILGAIWGWLPCGLVYSALAYSSTAQSAWGSALIMFGFGVGTLPAVFATGMAAQALRNVAQKRHIRYSAALLIIAFGAWTLWTPASSLLGGHDHGAHHGEAHPMQQDDHSQHHSMAHDSLAQETSNHLQTCSSSAAASPAHDHSHH